MASIFSWALIPNVDNLMTTIGQVIRADMISVPFNILADHSKFTGIRLFVASIGKGFSAMHIMPPDPISFPLF